MRGNGIKLTEYISSLPDNATVDVHFQIYPCIRR